MLKPQMTRLGVLALLTATSAGVRSPMQAQGTQQAQTVQLAFGYECDDRFLVRNDGAQPVDIEYNVAGSTDRSALRLLGRQSVEISSPSADPLELRVGGKLVSTAHKANHPCAPAQPAQPAVVVRPIEPRDAPVQAQPVQQEPQVVYQQQATLPAQVVYVEREPVYVAPAPYYYPYYYYPAPVFSLGFFGHFGGYGRTIVVGGRGRGGPHRR